MSLQFFGQFLLSRGEIDDEQLRQALGLMQELNRNLGSLAVEKGYASEADCRRVNDEQKRKNLPFGELAMQMGVLNSIELEELLQIQRHTRVDLAKAVVELGYLAADRVQALQDEWKSALELEPSGSNELPAALRGQRAAELGMSLFDRLCRRVSDLRVMVGPGRELVGLPDMVRVASVRVLGTRSLRITMMVDLPFGEQLAKGLLGMQLDSLAAELALEGVGEFLNVWWGNVVASLEEEALDLRLEAPSYGVLPTRGHAFEVVTENQGAALVVIEPITS